MNTTPIPWKILPQTAYSTPIARLVDANNRPVLSNIGDNADNAALIVRAVNNHDKLIDALEAVVATSTPCSADDWTRHHKSIDDAKEALKSAKQEV